MFGFVLWPNGIGFFGGRIDMTLAHFHRWRDRFNYSLARHRPNGGRLRHHLRGCSGHCVKDVHSMNIQAYLSTIAEWVSRSLPPPSYCTLETGMAGRRQKDFARHTNFWWCFFWPITFPMAGLVFATLAVIWLCAVLVVYGALFPLAILSVLVVLLRRVRLGPSEQCDETGP